MQNVSENESSLSESDVECQSILYSTPPSQEDYTKHRKANIIFKNLQYPKIRQSLLYNYCKCCGRLVGNQPKLRFDYDPMEAAYLGPGIPLFFAFFRAILYTLLVYLLGFGLPTLSSNAQGNNCQTGCGTQTFWNQISVFNIFNEYSELEAHTYFQLAIIIITIMISLFIRSAMNYMQIHVDQHFPKPSDYSIIIRNISQDAERQDIQQMIQQKKLYMGEQELQQCDRFKISQIIMIRDLKQFIEVQSQNLKLTKNFIKKKQKNPNLHQQFYKNHVVPQKFAKTAIIVFSNAKSKSYFLNSSKYLEKLVRTFWGGYYPKSSIYKIKQNFVSIYRAPEPDDLIWKNCGKSWKQLLLRRICLYLLSFIVLGIGGAIQYSIQFVRNKYVSVYDRQIQYGFSLIAALTVTTFNFLLSILLQFLATHEGHDTKTQLKVAITSRIVIFQFLNSGVLVVLSNIFVKITTDQQTYDFRKSVLASNIMQMMIINAINGNLTTFFFNKYQVFQLYNRRKIIKKTQLFTQIQANKIFQPPSINIHLKYAYVFKTFWLTVFFMPTVPLVILISLIGLVSNYWIQKYLFSGIYAAPETISSYLSNHVLNLLDYTPLWMTLGSLFVHFVRMQFQFSRIQPQIKNLHYIFLLLSVINIFLPYYAILKRFNKYKEPTATQTTYENAVRTFQLTYQQTNPTYLVHNKKRIRDEQIFKQQITKQLEFIEMRMPLSQSQILISHKQSLLNKSSTCSEFNVFTTRNRASSLNF